MIAYLWISTISTVPKVCFLAQLGGRQEWWQEELPLLQILRTLDYQENSQKGMDVSHKFPIFG